LTGFIAWTALWTIRDRQRQQALAKTRPPINSDEFARRLTTVGVDARIAEFAWSEFQPYYCAPLTPYPEDRPVSEMRIDPDDLSEMVTTFEKQFAREWVGNWNGLDDPTLAEFAVALISSTREK
jgi:hypothetical protein